MIAVMSIPLSDHICGLSAPVYLIILLLHSTLSANRPCSDTLKSFSMSRIVSLSVCITITIRYCKLHQHQQVHSKCCLVYGPDHEHCIPSPRTCTPSRRQSVYARHVRTPAESASPLPSACSTRHSSISHGGGDQSRVPNHVWAPFYIILKL